MKYILITFFVSVFASFQCKQKIQKSYTGSFHLKDSFLIDLSKLSKNIGLALGYDTINVNNETNIFFTDKFFNIYLCPLKDNPKITSYHLPDGLNLSEGYYCIKSQNNILYIYLDKKKSLHSFTFDEKGMTEKDVYDLSAVLQKDEFFMYNFKETFEINYPYICFPYGISNKQTNFLDETQYLLINLTKKITFENTKKIMHTQKALINQDYYNKATHIKFVDDSTLIYSFESSDSIYRYNFLKNTYSAGAKFNISSSFRKYDRKDKMDLGYLRWQEGTNEVNFKFFSMLDGGYFILKKLRKEKLEDRNIFEFFVLNENSFSIQANNIFPEKLFPGSCLPYKKGIIAFTYSMDKAYYYEL